MADYATNMAALPRHGHLVSSFFANIFPLFKEKKVYALQEQHALVFYGKKWSKEERLVDATQIENINEFKSSIIEELDFVQPDFILFENNLFIQSTSTLKTAGVPDLVIEVWAKSNTREERDMKHNLYSSHPKCEHWYLTHDSNHVECLLGSAKLKPQTLTDILITQHQINFDLRYLAI